MRILLDENFPLPLKADFLNHGHHCTHVLELGWQGTKNGQLLARAKRESFDVLITLDADMISELDLSAQSIAVYVLRPEGQGPHAARALLGEVLAALEDAHGGEVRIFTNRGLRRNL